ncbi:MAG: deoxyribonuclease IV [Bryobacteraceae bacterium]
MRIGAHVSVAGSLEGAAIHAGKIGANTIQIFSSSPRMWRGARLDPAEVARFAKARDRFDVSPLVVHANYLVNMAAAGDGIWEKSVVAFREELGRSIQLGADHVVVHPGSAKGQTAEQGMERFAAGLVVAGQGVKSAKLSVLLEITAGQGQALGARWEELAAIRRMVEGRVDFAVGYCLDTAHCCAAAVDFFEAAEGLGIERIPVIHANDSKVPWGSHVDRHEYIGRGHIGEDAFARILKDRRFRDKAFILETPFEEEGDDAAQVAILRRLAGD